MQYGFFRSDIMAVNGYNENLTGWGHEDLKLKQRMINDGMRVQRIKFCAVVFHL
jgi:predicted glycosyltransferase involved in capsule biosynthesis